MGLVLAVGISIGVALVLRSPNGHDESPGYPSPPLTAISPSGYRNTTSEARYVGSAVCGQCHAEQVESFGGSGMSRSLHAVGPADDLAEGVVEHSRSGRRFEVAREDGRLRHREQLTGDGPPLDLADHAVDYVIGSGARFTMYLCEIDGFLVESPLTWYVDRPGWAMSPGYDQARHLGFQREITTDCLFCHAGRAEAIDDSYHRIRIVEPAISCERCHGPGSLHVARRQTDDDDAGNEHDDTIVNPARLPRRLADSVCQQCHLRTTSYTDPRGRRLADFRPGLPIEDFQHFYTIKGQSRRMQVVGHTEQMLASRCYTRSGTMTCITCHNPHAVPDSTEHVSHYRRICLDCHTDQSCTAAPAVRARSQPANNCIGCHMPAVATKTLHVAATHHRIGVHPPGGGQPQPPGNQANIELEPFHDLSRFSQLDRQRSLGIATLKLSSKMPVPGLRDRALQLLLAARGSGLREGRVDATLALLTFPVNPAAAAQHAREALKDPAIDTESRLNALFALASHHVATGRSGKALELIDQLISMRRHAADWDLRARCLVAQRDIAGATRALDMAVSINPELLPAHRLLVTLYKDQGQAHRATHHRDIARRLTELFRTRAEQE